MKWWIELFILNTLHIGLVGIGPCFGFFCFSNFALCWSRFCSCAKTWLSGFMQTIKLTSCGFNSLHGNKLSSSFSSYKTNGTFPDISSGQELFGASMMTSSMNKQVLSLFLSDSFSHSSLRMLVVSLKRKFRIKIHLNFNNNHTCFHIEHHLSCIFLPSS